MNRLKDRPFALLGVNINGYDVKQLKEAVEKEKLNWRSFADPGELGRGAITRRWIVTTTPTVYLLDAKGTIRNKWIGNPSAPAIDAAIEALLKEVEGR